MPKVAPRPSSASWPGVKRAVQLGAGGRAERDQVGDQDGDRDQVVDDRRPHHRPEPAVGVEHLPDQHEHAVEEDLWQAVAGEGDDRLALLGQLGTLPGVAEVQLHHPGRRDHQHDRDPGQEHDRQGHHAVGVGLAAVGVVLHRPHQLGDQHGVEDAAGQQDVEHVRDRVGDVEQVGVQLLAEGGDQEGGAHEAAQPGDDRAGRHHGAGREDARGLAAGVGAARSVRSGPGPSSGDRGLSCRRPPDQAYGDRAEQQRHAGADDHPDHLAHLDRPDRQLVGGAQRGRPPRR